MNILMVYPHLIHSRAYHGGGGRIIKYIRYLSKRHNVSVICFYSEKEKANLRYTREFVDCCRFFKAVSRPRYPLYKKIVDFFLNPEPIIWLNIFRQDISELLTEVIRREDIEIIYFNPLSVGNCVRYTEDGGFIRVVLADDPFFKHHDNILRFNKSFTLDKMMSRIQYSRVKRFELDICKQFDKIIMHSSREKDLLLSHLRDLEVYLLPLSVDTEFFTPQAMEEDPLSISFVGNFGTSGNADAVLWFARDIFPIIKQKIPKAKLHVIGKGPPRSILKYNSTDFIVEGFIPDVRDYLSKSAVFVSPLRLGGGVRAKNLEAMAMGKPVVTTSLGAEGIGGKSDEDLIVEDDPGKFAYQVIRLLSSKQLRRSIGESGRSLVREKFDDRVVLDKFERMLQSWL